MRHNLSKISNDNTKALYNQFLESCIEIICNFDEQLNNSLH